MSTLSTSKKILLVLFKVWLAVSSFVGTMMIALIILLLVIGSALAKAEDGTSYPTKTLHEGSDDVVAVINLSGEILNDDAGSDPFAISSGVISSKKVVQLIEHVRDDDKVKAVVLTVNSPGGAVVPSDEIYRKVKELREKKPVVVSFGDVAASGGYYISSAADEIIANPATITGSIGVIAQFPQYSELLSKVGVEMRTFKSGQFKDIGSPNRALTDEEKAIIQSVITDSYNQFVSAVSQGRKMDEGTVRKLADGRIYTGLQAKENHLVDELGNVDTAIDHAKKRANVDDPTVVEYIDKGFFESIFSSSIKQINPVASLGQIIPHSQSGIYYLMQF